MTPTPAELRALLAKATPGEWRVSSGGVAEIEKRLPILSAVLPALTDSSGRYLDDREWSGGFLSDLQLAAAAVNALPAHLTRIEQLEAQVARLQQAHGFAAKLADEAADERDCQRERANAAEAQIEQLRGALSLCVSANTPADLRNVRQIGQQVLASMPAQLLESIKAEAGRARAVAELRKGADNLEKLIDPSGRPTAVGLLRVIVTEIRRRADEIEREEARG